MGIEAFDYAVNSGIIAPLAHAQRMEDDHALSMLLEQIGRQYDVINFATANTLLSTQRLALGLSEDDAAEIRKVRVYFSEAFANTVPEHLLILDRPRPFEPVNMECPHKHAYDESWIRRSREKIATNLRTIFALPDTSRSPDELHP